MRYESFAFISICAQKSTILYYPSSFYIAAPVSAQTSLKVNVPLAGRIFSKIYIALKECSETLYWLDLLYETDYLSESEYTSIKADCEEIRKMLSSSTKTLAASIR